MRSNGRIPQSIQDAPELLTGLQLYVDAWLDLTTCRNPGGPIPWTAICDWAAVHELDPEQWELLHAYMPAMDKAYFEFIEWKREVDKRNG